MWLEAAMEERNREPGRAKMAKGIIPIKDLKYLHTSWRVHNILSHEFL